MVQTFSLVYLAAMVAVVLVVLLVLHTAQRAALTELRGTLVRGDATRYLQMLDSPRLRLVLRRSTLAMLRLDGDIAAGDAVAVQRNLALLDTLRLRPEEALRRWQAQMDFALRTGDAQGAEAALAGLTALLQNETDPGLLAIAQDAQYLVRIYVRHDVSCIAPLRALLEQQQGTQRGITLYRLAKLYYVSGQGDAVQQALAQALPLLQNTPWEAIVRAAQETPARLEIE